MKEGSSKVEEGKERGGQRATEARGRKMRKKEKGRDEKRER